MTDKTEPRVITGEEAIAVFHAQREALDEVITFLRDENGPLMQRWENCDVGSFEDVDLTWDETLHRLDTYPDDPVAGYDDPIEVVIYRKVKAALALTPPEALGELVARVRWAERNDCIILIDLFAMGAQVGGNAEAGLAAQRISEMLKESTNEQ